MEIDLTYDRPFNALVSALVLALTAPTLHELDYYMDQAVNIVEVVAPEDVSLAEQEARRIVQIRMFRELGRDHAW
jgi:hypothetical protein